MYEGDIVLEDYDDDDDDDKNLLTRVKICEMAIRLMLIIQQLNVTVNMKICLIDCKQNFKYIKPDMSVEDFIPDF